MMRSPTRIRYLPAEDVAELLAEKGLRLTPSAVADLQAFIDEISGDEAADEVFETPPRLEAAA